MRPYAHASSRTRISHSYSVLYKAGNQFRGVLFGWALLISCLHPAMLRCCSAFSPLSRTTIGASARRYGLGATHRVLGKRDPYLLWTGRPRLAHSVPWSQSCRFSTVSSSFEHDSSKRYLFGDAPKSFKEINASSFICEALEATGKVSATAIQAAVYSHIAHTNKDAVIAAETGSGKTLAYLLPLIDKMMLEGSSSSTSTSDAIRSSGSDTDFFPTAVVLVPNKELGEQVNRMGGEIIGHLRFKGAPVTIGTAWGASRATHFSPQHPSPSILVCTPAHLTKYLKGPKILDPRLFTSIKYLVLDEADMLLDGEYRNLIERVMDAMKVTRREQIRQGAIKVHESNCQRILSAATIPTSGKLSIENYVKRTFPNAVYFNNSYFHVHHPRIAQRFIEVHNALTGSALDYADEIVAILRSPADEEKASQNVDASSISTTLLERETIDLSEVRGSESDATTASVDDTMDPTLIFVNLAETAESLAAALEARGVRCGQYHKMVGRLEDRMETLERFRQGDIRVIVATDHAARGLDLPNVRHVIQADFAPNVVQHMHRIGRASRGGLFGRATNFYLESSKHLVDEILRDAEGGSVDQAFSRRRALRRRVKRAADRDSSGEEPPARDEATVGSSSNL